ncbi:MAG: DUF2442 domain-containing protein [Solirubrobacterales bacterium]|nr:DUF2442 domain-containing protein [Solirubrobacterales bacterium]
MGSTRPHWVIRGVTVLGDHQLRLLFEDGTVGDVSFADYIWRGILEPLRDPKRFAKVTLKYGTLYWEQDDLDLPPEPLYEAARAHQLVPASAAA